MSMRFSYTILQAILLGLCSAWAGPALTATLSFTGQLTYIDTNTGSGRYAGATPGQQFSGSLSYGTLAEATTDPLFPGDYDFASPPFGGFISDGTNVTTGTAGEIVQVTVDDDVSIDTAAATLINSILGTSLTNGDVADIADIDTAYLLPGGGQIVFGVSLIALGGSAWSGTDLGNFPAQTGNYDHAVFFISEFDALGALVYEGFGVVTPVPVPPALLLFASGLLVLTGGVRRRCRL